MHRRRKTDNSIILVGYANPNEVFNLPLHAIYADYKDLYFAIKGYRTSVQGFVWNAYPSDENYSHQVQCDPIDAFEPLNINVRRKKHEIYFENTSKYRLLSAYYTIHLRPPLYLLNSLPIDIKVSVAGCLGRQSTPVQPVRGSGQLPGAERFQKEDFLDYGEKEVNPGHVLHLPTVRMFEKGKESKSVLVVRVSIGQ